MTRQQLDEATRHEPLFRRLAVSGTELVVVMGPNHSDDETAHWLGAMISVTGKVKGLPTLEAAVSDGLFATGSGRYLAAFDPKRVPPERLVEVEERTRHAVEVMQARIRGEAARRPRALVSNLPDSESPTDRAKAYATNTRLKFERVYASARRAIESGDTKTALIKCKAALQLLDQEVMFGPRQSDLVRTLTEEIALLDEPHASSPDFSQTRAARVDARR
jgi:hypothetical protein